MPTGKFEKGQWIPFKAIVHTWRFHCEEIEEYTDIQEAYDNTVFTFEYGNGSVEKIVVMEGEHIEEFPWGVYDDDGSSEKRLMERYGLKKIDFSKLWREG